MKKNLIILLIIILISTFIKIPKYIELNNLTIIDKVKIKCNDNNKTIILREIKPIKTDNGITYKYNYYKNNVEDISKIKKTYEEKYHKKFYYDKVKYLSTNCNDINIIKEKLNINPKKIKKE